MTVKADFGKSKVGDRAVHFSSMFLRVSMTLPLPVICRK